MGIENIEPSVTFHEYTNFAEFEYFEINITG